MIGKHRKGKTCQWLYDGDIAMIKAQGEFGDTFADVLHRVLAKLEVSTGNVGAGVTVDPGVLP